MGNFIYPEKQKPFMDKKAVGKQAMWWIIIVVVVLLVIWWVWFR